jgi:hypothetical protein
MKITQIKVSIHEKRNHPTEYGHYDSEVHLTAELEEEDIGQEDELIPLLRDQARAQVKEECDAWEQNVLTAQRIEHLRFAFENNLEMMEEAFNRENLDHFEQLAREDIEALPDPELQETWKRQLHDVKTQRIQVLKEANAA